MPARHHCRARSASPPRSRRVILAVVTDSSAGVLAFPAAAVAIELRHLRSFVAVAEELNFGRAAERLYITQPALSRQIRALEQLVGCKLLRRSTRRVELTLAGEALLEHARRLLREVDDAVLAVQSIGGEVLARITALWLRVGDRGGGDGDLQEQRTAYEALFGRFVVPAGVQVHPVNAGGVQALLVAETPDDPPGILFLHGGGLVLGSAFGYRSLAGALALACGRSVLIADYRLAPEHPYPAALDDAHAAYRWILDRGVSPAQLVLAGSSSGAGLALTLLLRLRDEGLPLPAGAVLLCPAVSIDPPPIDIDDDPSQQLLSTFWRRCAKAYLAGHPSDDPLVNPICGDLTGIPPLLVQTGTEPLILAEAHALHDRAQRHAVHTQLQLYPSKAHTFQLFWPFLPEAADALEAVGRFVRAQTATLADAPRS
jgi:monoterpene epsilon-lactone hydrolase